MGNSKGKRCVVRVIERKRILLPPEFDTARVRERLIAAAAAAGMPDALEQRRGGLFAKGSVGVIDIGDVAIEILPKTRDGSAYDEGRAFLVDLLRFVGRDRGPFATAAESILEGGGNLIEVLFAWVTTTTAQHADTGFPRRYVSRTDISAAVRGRIDMKSVALARPGREFELVIRHSPISLNNDICHAVRWLMREVGFRTRRSETRRIANSLLDDMKEVADRDADVTLFDRIILRPLEEHWSPVLAFGRSLVLQRSLDPASVGGNPSVAVLFTMHDLFERALRRVLHDHGPEAGLLPARIPRHLLRSEDGGSLVELKPDYAFRMSDAIGERTAVGDAKWKDIWTSSGEPDPRREDAYQLAAYMVASRADAGFLFAPLIGDSHGDPLRVFRHTMTGSDARVDIVGIHVPTLMRPDATGNALREDLCRAIAEAMTLDDAIDEAPSGPSI